MILILGATGVLGREVVRTLVADRRPVRAATRQPDMAGDLSALGAEVVHADLIDSISLRRACTGVDAVFVAAHSLMGTGRYSSVAVDGAGHRALIDAARTAGVRRFVYTSVRGAAADHPVDFFRTKAAVERYLEQSGLDFTILRPSAFMEWHVHRLLGKGIVETGKAIVFGSGNAPTNFIAGADVAQYARAALEGPGMSARTLELGGPDNVTRRQVVELYERYAGRSAKVTYVPVVLMRMMSPLVRPFMPVVSRLLDASIWGDTTDQTFASSSLPPDIPSRPTSVEAFVRAATQKFVPSSA
jgi:uncharacterized protein YbjT (DUF2867 family)